MSASFGMNNNVSIILRTVLVMVTMDETRELSRQLADWAAVGKLRPKREKKCNSCQYYGVRMKFCPSRSPEHPQRVLRGRIRAFEGRNRNKMGLYEEVNSALLSR